MFEQSVEVSGEVALEAAVCFAAAFPVCVSTGDVVDRWLVPASAGYQDHVEGAVESTVA